MSFTGSNGKSMSRRANTPRADRTLLFKKAATYLLLFSFLYSPFLASADEFTLIETSAPDSGNSTQTSESNGESLSSSEDVGIDGNLPDDIDNLGVEVNEKIESSEAISEKEGFVDTPIDPIAYAIVSDDGDSAEIVKSVTNDRRIADVDQSNGSLRYSIPIESPPGRNQTQPNLSLEYSSQVLDSSSIVGYGWKLNIPYIERRNVSGAEDLYSQDYFYSSLSGQLATTSSSTQYKAEVDEGDYLTYEYQDNFWTVFDKKGNVFKFGLSPESQISSAATSTQTYRWALSEIMDANGNYVSYDYLKNDGQIYPYEIVYTNFASSTGPFEIEFSYEARPDISTSTIYGFPVITKQRVSSISVKESGSWVRKYDLAYTFGDNGRRSLLNTVVKSGNNGLGNIIDLPAIDFSYETSTITPVWGNMSLGHTLIYSEAVRYGDINGDGLTDIVYSNDERNEDKQFYINQGNGAWESIEGDSFPIYFFKASNSSGDKDRVYYGRLVDLNGDMLADVYDADSGNAYINNGDLTWTENPNWNYNPPCSGECVQLADVNGDRLTDLIYSWELRGTPGVDKGIKLNTGTGWSSLVSANGLPDGEFYWESNSTCCKDRIRPISMIDVNGDGLADYVNGGGSVSINMGDLTWVEDPTWAFQPPNGGEALRYGDINNDGLVDIMSSYRESYDPWQVHVFINQGDGWIEDSNWADNFPSLFYWYPNSSSKPRKNYDRGIADFDGDGAMDILDGSGFAINRASHTDLLTGIESVFGGDTEITYTQSSLERDSMGQLSNPELPYTVNIVSGIKHFDTYGTDEEATYSYMGGDFHFNNFIDRKFSGFELIQESSDGKRATTYFHQGNETSTTTNELQDEYGLIGKPFKEIIADDSGNPYKITTTDWDVATQTNSRLVTKGSVLELTYDGNASHKDSAVTYDYDSAGNLLSKIQWGEVNGSEDGSFIDLSNDAITSIYTYASSSHMYLQSSELVQNSSTSLKVKETKLFYDALPAGELTKGNLTKKQEWISGSNYVTTESSYNEFGLIASSTDPRGNVTSYDYDSFNLYPETTTNSLGQTISFIYDYTIGKPTEIIDQNDYIYEFVFDGLGRLKRERKPDSNNPSSTVITDDYDYFDNANPVKVKKTEYLVSNVNKDTYYYLDGMGRIIQTRSSTADSGTWAVKDTEYGLRGLKVKESLPYFDEGYDRTPQTSDDYLYTQYQYDSLDRVVLVENALGSTEHEYDQWADLATDARGNEKIFYKNAFKQLVQVDERNATSTYTTTYGYDELGNLTKIVDANGNVRNFSYDGMSRRISAEDLHDIVDSSYGTWWYSYDDSGNLLEVTDPKNQIVQYTYDALNRVLTEDFIGQPGIEISYTYDSCIGGVGKLCSVDAGRVETIYAYTATGEIATTNKIIDSDVFELEKTYDKQGNVTSITYPDGSRSLYLYNDANQVEEISFVDLGQSTSTLIAKVVYDPAGQPLSISYGEVATSTYGYDAQKMYLLNEKLSFGSTTVFQNSQYEYDPVGNITRIVEAAAGPISKIIDYDYDDLSRLVSASTTASLYRLVTSTTTSSLSNGRDYFTKISIPGVNVSGPIANIPIYVNLADLPASFFSHAAPGCGDVRVFAADMTGELPRQIVNCNNASSTGELHFKADLLTNATTTNDFYLYYGTTTPVSDYSRNSTYGADNVWTGYGAVFHLNNDPSAVAPQLQDSSFNQRNATTEGAMTSGASIDMKLGKGLLFDNSNDSASFSNAVPGTNPFVISFWASKTSTDHDRVFSGTNTNRIFIDANFQTTFSAEIGWRNGSTNVGVGVIATSTYSDGLPHHVQIVAANNGTSNRAKLDLYVDGVLRGTAQSPSYSYNISSLSRGWWLGKTKNWSSGANEGLYGGKLDEVRFYNGTTSPEKILTEYQNQASTTAFYIVGPEERTLTVSTSSAFVASSSYAYKLNYTYDALGNLLSNSRLGTYQYSEEGNVNPHAVTQVASTTYAYDQNGNLIQAGDASNSWDYRNRIASSTFGVELMDYLYDQENDRMKYVAGTTTVVTPMREYEVEGDISRRNIYLDDQLLATIEKSASSTRAYYIMSDHLMSTSVIIDEEGEPIQFIDYEPYGAINVNYQVETRDQRSKYLGEKYDQESGYSYLNARYYDGGRGQFLSQDPVFLGIGVDSRTAQALQDPQLMNSYSYARNNPIVYKDPNGEWVHVAAGALIGGGIGFAGQGIQDAVNGNLSGYQAYAGAVAGGATFGAVTAATGGLSLVGAGVVGVGSGVVQSGVEQGLNMASGNQEGFDVGAVGSQAVSNGVTSLVPGLKVAPISVGRGSFEAVQKQIYTKLSNGTISITGIQPSTVGKIVTAGFAQQLPGIAAQSSFSPISKQIQQLQKQVNQLKQQLSKQKNK